MPRSIFFSVPVIGHTAAVRTHKRRVVADRVGTAPRYQLELRRSYETHSGIYQRKAPAGAARLHASRNAGQSKYESVSIRKGQVKADQRIL